jgi:hypothetical protein
MKAGMEVYLGNLPPRVTAAEVHYFLQAALDRNLSRRLVQAIFRGFVFERDVRVQVVDRRSKRRRYRFAHILFADSCVARFFIEELNGLRMRGNRLEARQYFRRANDYEDYAALDEQAAWTGRERRGVSAGVVAPTSPPATASPAAPQ